MRKRRRDEDGASLVEFVMVMPVLVALLFAIIEFGFVFNSYMQLRHGTREGARLAAVNNGCVSSSTGCSGTADEQRDALVASTRASLVGLADPDEMTIWLDYTAATVGSDVTVCVTYPLHSTTGLFSSLLDSKTLKSTSTMRIEQVATFSRSGGTSPC